jgi:hypothetical protein
MFAKDKDFDLRLSRMDQEQNSQRIMMDYFSQRISEKNAEKKLFLEEFGLTPAETEEVLARKRIEDGLKALDKPIYRKTTAGVENAIKLFADRETKAKKELEERKGKSRILPEMSEKQVPKAPEESAYARTGRPMKEKTISLAGTTFEKIKDSENPIETINGLTGDALQAVLKVTFGITPKGKKADYIESVKREYAKLRK